MFGRTNKVEAEKLDAVEAKLLKELEVHDPESKEFQEAFNHLERVINLRSKEKKTFSPDQMLLVFGNLLGILIVVAYEQKHVMTSKAKDFTLKPK